MDKKLLTPGPLTTSMSTKEAMLHDWGSRDTKFIDLNASIRDSLVTVSYTHLTLPTTPYV